MLPYGMYEENIQAFLQHFSKFNVNFRDVRVFILIIDEKRNRLITRLQTECILFERNEYIRISSVKIQFSNRFIKF